MATQIISKRCPKCKQIKPFSEFHKSKNRKDGHCVYCNICRTEFQRQYRKTEKGKSVSRKGALRYSQSKKGKAKRKHYRQSERGKSIEARYRKSEKGKQSYEKTLRKYRQTDKYKEASKKALRNYKQKHPDKVAANNATNNAIKTGKLPRPDTLKCLYCPAQAKDYHHQNGYAKAHWLDVIPVCKQCHNSL